MSSSETLPDHVLVVMDEAYSEYIDDPRFPDSFAFPGGQEHPHSPHLLQDLRARRASAGLRIRPERDHLRSDEGPHVSFNVNRLSQAAGLAALGDVANLQRALVNNAGKALLYDAYQNPGPVPPPDMEQFHLRRLRPGQPTVFEGLQKRGIITRTIKEYGFPRALRITIGTEPQNQRLIRALKKVI